MILLTISIFLAPWTFLQLFLAPGTWDSSICMSKKMIHTCYIEQYKTYNFNKYPKFKIATCTKESDMYWPSVSSLKQKKNRNKIVITSLDIYTCTVIFLFYKCKKIPTSYSTHLLMETGLSALQNKYHMLSNYCSCKQLTPNDT